MPVESKRVQSVFLMAVEAAGAAGRAAVLDRECGGDAELRQRVEALLLAHDGPDSFLASAAGQEAMTGAYTPAPGAVGAANTAPRASAEGPGTRIGPYKLLQQIGEGGMGIVWMAEQQEPVRRLVALKVVRAGTDSAQVVARFEAERQALALMDHPNIAKVLDAGTMQPIVDLRLQNADLKSEISNLQSAISCGRPYFVMELVKGVPITKYCDEQRLTPGQRLEFFIPVCQALQHAHQKGIIHRDIKPSNVLVAPYDGKPVVKVIDFGIAKATGQRLTERTMFTEFGAVIGTLEYMSPEQAELNNQDIDTRSDIYSLGVLLYELLTGTTPLDRTRLQKAAFTEMLRMIREEDPPRPSTRLSESGERLPSISAQRHMEPARLSKLVRGDLDWIVMKALEKDRSRRYETANGLARDIEHLLKEEPVEACPPSAGYRLRKFLRRNKGVVAAAALVLLALVIGIAGTTWGLVRAKMALADEAEQRGLAERERDEKEQARAATAHERDEKDKARAAAEQERDEKEQARAAADKHRQEAAAARDQAERVLYFNRINLAQQYWQSSNLVQSRRILDACPSGTRDWEWRYLDRLHHADVLTLPHNVQFRALNFSKDGKRMAAFAGITTRIWDMTTNKALAEISSFDHKRQFTSAALSPDGKTVVLGEQSGVIGFWEADTGRYIREFAHVSRSVDQLSFSPDGRWLAAARANSRNGEMLLPFLEPARNEDLVVWDIATGKEAFHPKGFGFVAHFSPDSSRLLTFKTNNAIRLHPSIPEYFVALLDTADWKEIAGDKLGSGTTFAFSGDGKRLALGGWDRQRDAIFVRMVDPASGQELLSLAPKVVGDIALNHDGTILALSEGLASTKIEVWDLTKGRRLRALRGHTNSIYSITFAPDGRLASCSLDSTIKFWNPIMGQDVRQLAEPSVFRADPAVFSPGGKLLAFATRFVLLSMVPVRKTTVIDSVTGHVERTWAGHPGGTVGLAFSRDGKRLATRGRSDEAKVWDLQTGRELAKYRHEGQVAALAISPDGRWVASTHEQKEITESIRSGIFQPGKVKWIPIPIKVWDAASGKERWSLAGHLAGVNNVAFSSDGRLLASGDYPTVRIWDLATGTPLRELNRNDFLFGINFLVFSRDGSLLVTGGSSGMQQPMAQLWDVATGKSVARFQGHQPYKLDGLAISPDQKRLATAAGREVKIWDMHSGQEALTVPLPEPGADGTRTSHVVALAWTEDGQRLRAALSDASVVEWDGTPR